MSLPRRGLAASTTAAFLALATILIAPCFVTGDPLFQDDSESYDVGDTQAFLPGAFQSTPTGVAPGDMNGDGLTDLVVACPGGSAGAFTGSTVSVLLRRAGTAVPAYLPKIDSPTGTSTGAVAVAVGDLNGDGKLDAVTADYGSGTVSVLLGDGAGNLVFTQQAMAGTHPRGVALGDLDGDGFLDVVAANSGSNTISVWLNTGSGSLGARTDYATPAEPRGVVIGQFNADSAPDVVSCNYLGGTITLFTNQNNVTGALNAGVSIPVGNKPAAIAAGPLDANTTTDVAVACSSRVVTRLSNGAGGFGGGLNLVLPFNPLAIAVKQFVVTGADVALAGDGGRGGVNVAYLANVSGASVVGAQSYVNGGPTPWGVAFASSSAGTEIAVANTGDMAAADPTHTVSLLRRNGLGGFGATLSTTVATTTDRVVSVDVNRDGIPDAVMTGADPNGLVWMQGLGDGTFQNRTTIASGGGTHTWVGALDANRDAISDVLFYNPAAAEMRICLGTGSGFAGPTVAETGYGEPCVIGDLNRDGIPDFVATSGASFRVFIGSGTGTFSAFGPISVVGPTAIRALTLGDWNRDAKLDVALSTDAGVVRYLGNGDGTFGSASTVLSGHSIRGGAVADVNQDGVPDLAVGEEGTTPLGPDEKQGVDVLYGNGVGGFGSPQLFPALDVPQSLAIADVNRDGKPDILAKNGAATPADPQGLSVLLGGSLAVRADYAAGSNPLGMALGDFNRDGLMDVAGMTAANGGAIGVLRGIAGAAFGNLGPRTDYGNVGVLTAGADGADVDGDGDPDFVMVGTIGGMPYAGTLSGNGAGAFLGGSVAPITGGDPRSCVLADLNRDGRLDLVVGNGNSTNIYVMLGSFSTFGPALARATNFPPQRVAVGDLNRDGIPDVITANNGAQDISILLGDGTGNFGAPTTLSTVNGVTGIAIGDMNRDGLPDIVATGGGTGVIRLHLQQSNGTFATNGNVTLGPGTISPVFGDFNRDGWPDVAVGNSGGGGRITVILGDGFGGMGGSGNQYSLPSPPTQVRTADINGDGVLDLIASEPGSVSVLLGAGGPGGGFSSTTSYPAATAQGLAILDMNRDGKPDVVAGNSTEQTGSVFLNGGSVPTGVAVGTAPPARPLLSQNAPNPFNPRTEIRFTMPRAGHARLSVYDAAGRRVATLLDGSAPAGERRVEWAGKDDAGHAVASGIYFYKLDADGTSLSRRMALLK
ncbi:MAG TPA: FG-GAP-like repeat-containing protein [Candidatus Binatia bacterium]|nr:FG-GAP-like repeat-containing protein [Candidatus Binatia bacterium]